MVLMFACGMKAHTPVMWVALIGENSKLSFEEQENPPMSVHCMLVWRKVGKGKEGKIVITSKPKQHWFGDWQPLTDFYHPNFGKVPTFLALGARMGERESPITNKNNLRTCSKSNSSTYHFQHCRTR